MRKKFVELYDELYLGSYNNIIADYRSVFDNMLDSGTSVPPKLLAKQYNILTKRYKKDIKTMNKRIKKNLKFDRKTERQALRVERRIILKEKLKKVLNKLNFIKAIKVFIQKRKIKRLDEQKSSQKNEK